MATPRRIYSVYKKLCENATTVRDFQVAAGEKVSGTVGLLIANDRGKMLSRWGEEMVELTGVLTGEHDDPYILESMQAFYWACLYAVSGGVEWESLRFLDLRQQTVGCRIESSEELAVQAKRLVTLGPGVAKPEKLFLLWWVADSLYRAQTLPDNQWSVETIMETDLQEMKKRPYLAPILAMVPEDA